MTNPLKNYKKAIVISVVVAVALLMVAVKACIDKPDPYKLKISKDDGLELVVPQD